MPSMSRAHSGHTLPLDDTRLIGRQLISNTAFQARFDRIFWPELEVNAIDFKGGLNDGKKQVFLTPGLLIGRFRIQRIVRTDIRDWNADRRKSNITPTTTACCFRCAFPLQSHPRE